MAQIMPKYHLACRRGGAFCKSIVSTARRGGVPFVRTKGTKIRLGLCPKTPYPLSCGWIRINFLATAENIDPYGAADTLSRCLRRILFCVLAETELKINLISVV